MLDRRRMHSALVGRTPQDLVSQLLNQWSLLDDRQRCRDIATTMGFGKIGRVE